MEIQPIKENKFIIKLKTLNINNSIKAIIIPIFILLILYLGISIYFSNHFYFNSVINSSVINNINSSGKTVEELHKEILSKCDSYTLELKERNGVTEQIKAADIKLKYNAKDKIQALKDSQNSFKWIYAIFNPKVSEISDIVTYDEKLLKERFDKLSCFDSKKVIEPKDSYTKYSTTNYVVVNEIMGTKVSSKPLYANVVNSIGMGETTINLEAENYYINPKYTSNSKEILNTKKMLNKYIASIITYTFPDGKEVLDGSIINTWIRVDKNLAISFDEIKIKKFLSNLDTNYDTYGKKISFVTSLGTKVKVNGGNYGWLVDHKGEVQDLIVAIKGGQAIAKEPKYIQTAASHNVNDIGNTYVEINIAKQHLWFYKNAKLIVDGDVVTGNVSKKFATPTGAFRLNYKEKNATLKGLDYSTDVNCFMPFNKGIGIHGSDSWRHKFGGTEYLKKGSHGCVNASDKLAITIFNNIDAGTPVICY
ncbi:L,D-transpeptidase family protein [Clostridium sp.]|uniref:L,D-transpeptidase family protein n=1 Tax=Clostridium sp. TaxID=1506 RepID=UPI003D6C87C8